MTVQEFYNWCKARKLTDAVMEISLKYAGQVLHGGKVKEKNIDYGLRRLPHDDAEKYIRLGG